MSIVLPTFKDFLFNSVIGEEVTAYRVSKDTGCDMEGVRRWFIGDTLPSMESAKKIAETYDYDLKDLWLIINIFKNPPELKEQLLKTVVIK